MQAQIQKWGSSLALRIPKSFALENQAGKKAKDREHKHTKTAQSVEESDKTCRRQFSPY